MISQERQMPVNLPRTYTPREVGDVLQVTTEFVYDQCRARRWPHLRVGSKFVRFTDEQIDQILELITMETKPPAREPETEPARQRNQRLKRVLGA